MEEIRLQIYEGVNGEVGLYFKDKTNYLLGTNAIYSGIQFAHDLIEHQNGINNIGTFEDEFEAVGGTWFTRGELGDFVLHQKDPYQIMAGEVMNIIEEMIEFKSRDLNSDSYIHSTDIDAHETWQCIEKDVEVDRLSGSVLNGLDYAYLGFLSGHEKAKKRFGDSITANNAFNDLKNIFDAATLLLPSDFNGLQGLELPLKIPEELRKYIRV